MRDVSFDIDNGERFERIDELGLWPVHGICDSGHSLGIVLGCILLNAQRVQLTTRSYSLIRPLHHPQ